MLAVMHLKSVQRALRTVAEPILSPPPLGMQLSLQHFRPPSKQQTGDVRLKLAD